MSFIPDRNAVAGFSPEAVELYNLTVNESKLYERRKQTVRDLVSSQTSIGHTYVSNAYLGMICHVSREQLKFSCNFTTQQMLEAALLLCIEDQKQFKEEGVL